MRRALLLLLLLAPSASAADLIDRVRLREKPIGKDEYGRMHYTVVASLAPIKYFTAPVPQIVVPGGGGGGSSITSGTTTITGGTDKSPCFDDAGVINCGDTGWSFDKTTDTFAAVAAIFSSDLTATAANAVSVQETAGCVTFEGATSNTLQTRLCVVDPTGADALFNLPSTATTATLATISTSQSFTSTQTFATALAVTGTHFEKFGTEALTAAAATPFVRIAVASGARGSGYIQYSIEADDGTDFQMRTGILVYSVVNKAGTETCTLGRADGGTTVDNTTDIVAASSGTLTNTFTCDTTPANAIDISANAASSLVETTLRINYQVMQTANAVVTVTTQ